MDSPDVAGRDLTLNAIEKANVAKVEKILGAGYPPAVLSMSATQVRLETLINAIVPQPERWKFELVYERSIGQVLDNILADVVKEVHPDEQPEVG